MRWGSGNRLRRLLQMFTFNRRPKRWKGTSSFFPAARSASPRKSVRWHSSTSSKSVREKSAASANSRQQTAWSTTPRKPKSKRKFWLIALIIFSLLSIQMFLYVDKHIRPPLMHLAKIRMKQMTTQAINKAISEQIIGGRPLDKLFEQRMDNEGKVSSFILNSAEHMRITSETASVVENAMHEVEVFKDHIPLGQALGSALIASFGPRIPVKMEPQGAVKVELSTRPQEVGINNVLVEVYIKVTGEVSIVIPYDSEPEVIEVEIPISYLLVVGNVPLYYYDSKGNPVGTNREQAPALSLPSSLPDKNKESNQSDSSADAPSVPTDIPAITQPDSPNSHSTSETKVNPSPHE